jgi:hypothetical protein
MTIKWISTAESNQQDWKMITNALKPNYQSDINFIEVPTKMKMEMKQTIRTRQYHGKE